MELENLQFVWLVMAIQHRGHQTTEDYACQIYPQLLEILCLVYALWIHEILKTSSRHRVACCEFTGELPAVFSHLQLLHWMLHRRYTKELAA